MSDHSNQSVFSTAQIRQIFLEFFAQQQHQIVPSSSLVPVGDNSLFFTNAGMVQFKNVFLGAEQRAYKRATSVQRCLRASGKHNDLENVGYTKRHHTFFEMLGNFSFGDYFKPEAIHFAWSFLTERLAIPAERLWITVHRDDKEAEQLWRAEFTRSGHAAQGISYCDDHDNFWSMGDTGPCGYCSEIFYDHGASLAGDPPGGALEGERYVEIWNLVFMQFERNAAGERQPLPRPSIDTGIGLERLAAVLQGVHDNYDIDLFQQLRADFARLLQTYQEQHTDVPPADPRQLQLTTRVAVDHIRSTVFLIADGVLPSNEKHGYVLRSILRRALFYLYRIGIRTPFFYQLVPSVVQQMGAAYEQLDLAGQQTRIMAIVREEEERFLATIERGITLLQQEIAQCSSGQLSGAVLFKMHDTYGLPLALSSELARQAGLSVDQAGFEQARQARRTQSRQDAKKYLEQHYGSGATGDAPWWQALPATQYHERELAQRAMIQISTILAIGRIEPTRLEENAEPTLQLVRCEQLTAGQHGVLILDHSDFWAESGGAVGDSGQLIAWTDNPANSDNQNDPRQSTAAALFQVTNTKKQQGVYLHYGQLARGSLQVGMQLANYPDWGQQDRVRANHSATHLLQASLRRLLGDQVYQRGSLVEAEGLRFDFAYNHPLTSEQCAQIEQLVNQAIWDNLPVTAQQMPLAEAKQSGAMALFGERYGEIVRVVSIGDFSCELCGGLHVPATGRIGSFKIEQEMGVAAGVRRIVATTRDGALASWQRQRQQLATLAQRLAVSDSQSLLANVDKLLAQNRQQHQQLLQYQQQTLEQIARQLWQQRVECSCPALATPVQLVIGLDSELPKQLTVNQLKAVWDHLKAQPQIILVLSITRDQRQHWLVGVGAALAKSNAVSANQLLAQLMQQLQGKGGGSGSLAQGSVACTQNSQPSANQLTRDPAVLRDWIQQLL